MMHVMEKSDINDLYKTYTKLLGLFIVTHLVVWAILMILFHPNMAFDMTEVMSWGHEWQMGYEKHPPLSYWIAEAFTYLFSNRLWSFYFLAQLNVVVAFIYIWRLAKEFLSPIFAVMSVLVLEGVYYFTFVEQGFNPNVLMLPLWSMIAFYFWRGFTRGRTLDWVVLGIVAALGLLAKYYTMTLLLSLLFFCLSTTSGRRIMRSRGPYIALGTLLVLILPHFVWVITHSYSGVYYVLAKLHGSSYHWWNHIYYPINYMLSQLAACAVALWMFFIGTKARSFSKRISSDDEKNERSFILFIVFCPLALSMLYALISGAELFPIWGTPLCNFVGILLFYFFDVNLAKATLKRFLITFVIVMLFAMTVWMLDYGLFFHRRAQFNGQLAAMKINEVWNQQHKKSIPIVGGTLWLAGNIAYNTVSRPSVFTELRNDKAAWLNIEDMQKRGGVIVWNASEGHELPKRYQNIGKENVEIQIPIILPWHRHSEREPYVLSWAIVNGTTADTK